MLGRNGRSRRSSPLETQKAHDDAKSYLHQSLDESLLLGRSNFGVSFTLGLGRQHKRIEQKGVSSQRICRESQQLPRNQPLRKSKHHHHGCLIEQVFVFISTERRTSLVPISHPKLFRVRTEGLGRALRAL